MPVREDAHVMGKRLRKNISGPKPVSKSGHLPGRGVGEAARANRFALWLKARRVRSLHRSVPLDQETMARLTGLNRQKISHWEQGSRIPTRQDLKRVADFFGEDLDYVYPMLYMIPDDMQYFLTATVEGEFVMKKVRHAMDQLENKAGFHVKPFYNEDIYKWQFNKIDGHTSEFMHFVNMEEDELINETANASVRVKGVGDVEQDTGTVSGT